MGQFAVLLQGHAALQDRAEFSRSLLGQVQATLKGRPLCSPDELCIYAAGSLAREETGKQSDLDVFFIARSKRSGVTRTVSRLGEIQVFAELIRVNEALSLEPFSGDGQYLKVHELSDIIEGTGSSDDDSENLFTTRLLLLLESKPLSGLRVHTSAMKSVLEMYFRDGRGRKDFRPLFLLNDILRYWRTLCLNYERDRAQPGKPWWKRNLNLKFPRKLTVFSTVIAVIASHTRSAADFASIAKMTPMQRLAFALDRMNDPSLVDDYAAFLDDYEFFLAAKSHRELDQPSADQLSDLSDRAQRFDDFLHRAFASETLERRLVRYVMI